MTVLATLKVEDEEQRSLNRTVSSGSRVTPTLGRQHASSSASSLDFAKLRTGHGVNHPFARTLSTVTSYEQMKRDNRLADYHLKIVVVGDGTVGKTSLLMSYVQKTFPTEYVPTVFENYVTTIEGPQDKCIELALWDTAGQEEYNRLRPLSYTNVDILMICYAVDNRNSFKNAEDIWYPEVKHFCSGTPKILVGLKSDLYAGEHINEMVEPKEGDLLAEKIGAVLHLQCSAKLRDNIDELFDAAIDILLADELYTTKEPSSLLRNPFKKSGTFSPYNKTGSASNGQNRSIKVRKHKCSIF
ncbi:Rho family GTPase RHO4 KNAG_0C01260 [Huiozyma naganishii CBS 8797]|uniref:GTP-binding protein RHO4 n=1 Tax=Huiozyma naganishii (strain ATCC MYA-139 / BCRC 22969 / CBS 8797 / KCTC 17520 / NBRC 10181 / NCYC 3082 / Yp74L-3) TaxID=1071383 RepID=J7S4D5_HUIN7|nr:hypothetical protein KNAG_0C01260 [Kazachstania naganishii CBS 8797]CCK69239.1 hypothetical protein KNAG_0C01260 [Kazachstania naganishii CBS 8797]